MAEPTHDEHLTQIRDRSRRLAEIPLETGASNYIMRDMIDSIGDVRWLLERLERLERQQTLTATVAESARDTAAYRVHRMLIHWVGQLTHDEEAAVRELLDEHTELVRLRAQLAEIGETKAEWAADGPAGWFQSPAGASSEWSERLARGVVEGAAKKGVEAKLKRRLVGGWRDAE